MTNTESEYGKMWDQKLGDPWFQTVSGKKFHFLNPRPEDIDIFDIAHALSHVNRFNGHVPVDGYSVGQHSVYVSEYCQLTWIDFDTNIHLQLHALLHDASEAYICDLCSPLKHCGLFDNYLKIEDNIQKAIFSKLGLNKYEEFDSLIKDADRRVLASEALCLLNPRVAEWDKFIEINKPIEDLVIVPWHPKLTQQRFLKLYFDLQDDKNEHDRQEELLSNNVETNDSTIA